MAIAPPATAIATSPSDGVRAAFAAAAPARCEDFAGLDPAALLARVDALRGDDDPAGAERALACAAPRVLALDDPRVHYELVRRAGILEYGRDRPSEALVAFECAQHLADALGDRDAAAKQWKNIGSSLRRIGDDEDNLNMNQWVNLPSGSDMFLGTTNPLRYLVRVR
jgi:hypothetical protein